MSAADLKASYEVFSKRLPDAVLLDINLGPKTASTSSPGCAKNRKCANPRDCRDGPRLVTEREAILQAGCGACLSKPIDFQLLQKELNRWLQGSKTSWRG